MCQILVCNPPYLLPECVSALWREGYAVTLLQNPGLPLPACDLVLLCAQEMAHIEAWLPVERTVLVWNGSEDTKLALAAYAAGAAAVLPAQISASLLLQRVRQMMPPHSGYKPDDDSSLRRTRYLQTRYLQGQPIHVDADLVMVIESGVVAQTVIHADGSEVLLGFYGPDQLLIPHPDDGCFIHLKAHTDTHVRLLTWAQAALWPDFAERLRLRLRLMEAWSANQARPHLADRVLGLLTLLGEQFGVVTAQGLRVDVRITHAQIATAVGAARTTVTRILGELRSRRLVISAGTGEAERFYLPSWQDGHHNSPSPKPVPIATLSLS